MQVRHVIGLILLLAAMPLQLYLMKYNQNFRNLVSEIVKNLSSDLLQLSIDVAGYVSLAKNYLQTTYNYLGLSKSFEDNTSENQEVPENLIRNFRPPHLKFSVGNVILTHTMIAGIVVGWNIDKTDLTKEPEYLIITEFHEDLIKIDQDKIIIQLENIKVDSKKIDHYFESFDGIKYIPNKLLQKMYPKD
ncbi:uncharacterized protein LOC113548385 isoform X1 [Rhopalosiphum maidis]|uniref:uncharacterized protein LOC113548385 isoform X1 n=1 Tax=Rhopalosiphum maidis TaxID=43146 RepID=UPI000F00499C|nr:uncharacterized protein LOC113548385 isoform X1 [Rhopalosiphum maidis]